MAFVFVLFRNLGARFHGVAVAGGCKISDPAADMNPWAKPDIHRESPVAKAQQPAGMNNLFLAVKRQVFAHVVKVLREFARIHGLAERPHDLAFDQRYRSRRSKSFRDLGDRIWLHCYRMTWAERRWASPLPARLMASLSRLGVQPDALAAMLATIDSDGPMK